MNRSGLALVSAAIAASIVLSSCADTVIEADPSAPAEGSVELRPTTTVPIVGTASELLPQIGAEMRLLSAQISGDGDEQATLARIEAIWAVAEPEVEASRRDIAGGVRTSIAMARTAVTRIRPADADKALSIFRDLADRYIAET